MHSMPQYLICNHIMLDIFATDLQIRSIKMTHQRRVAGCTIEGWKLTTHVEKDEEGMAKQ